MTLIKQTTEKTIRSIMKSFKGDTEFKFTPGELDSIVYHCNILKDMSTIPFEEGKKLQKNVSIASELLAPIQADATLINERREDMNERASKAATPDDLETLKKERKNYASDVEKYNKKKHTISLFTVSEEKFVKGDEDIAKFGIKKIPQQQGQPPIEIERYPSFLELLGLGIITEKA